MTARPLIAALDVDGTLTTRDCVVPFMRRVADRRRLATRLPRLGPAAVGAAARRDRDRLKALAARAVFAGLDAATVGTDAEAFADEVHSSRLRPDTLAELRAHRDHGDPVVLVSASFELYLDPLARLLPADAVLGTRLQVGADGRFTGELAGANCRGAEKVRRLHAWLADHHGGREAVEVVAYGDSAGDRELLADADVAHWVGG